MREDGMYNPFVENNSYGDPNQGSPLYSSKTCDLYGTARAAFIQKVYTVLTSTSTLIQSKFSVRSSSFYFQCSVNHSLPSRSTTCGCSTWLSLLGFSSRSISSAVKEAEIHQKTIYAVLYSHSVRHTWSALSAQPQDINLETEWFSWQESTLLVYMK